MKFSDGMWLVKENVHVEYAEEVRSITTSSDALLSLTCPAKQIQSRGDTLNIAVLTIDLEAVFDDVISVTTTHWKGARNPGPHFPLFPNGNPAIKTSSITSSPAGTTLTSGSLSATVSSAEHTFDVRFHPAGESGKLVTSLLNHSVGIAYNPPPTSPRQLEDMTKFKHYVFTQHTLSVGEQIYGLGERFTAFNKVGQSVILRNEDGGTSTEQAYKNVPFYISSRGYGVFINHTETIELEIGSERCSRCQVSVENQRLQWYIIYGPTPKEILRKYAILTGRPGKVPSWSLGLWLSTSFTTQYDDKTVNSFIDGMKERDIPVHVFHYDCFWMREFHWCDFIFSPTDFPDPAASIAALKKKSPGLKICVWINSYLGDASPVFQEAANKGYLLKRKNGNIWQWDLWQAGMGIVDFTNPAACEWYAQKLEGLFDIGVDCLKTDFGERIPDEDVVWHDATLDPKKMHNFYTYIYNQVVYKALQKRYGTDQAVLFARCATAGTQQFPLQWGGDCESTFEAMAESLRGGLSLGLSGFSYWSVDIGGFEGTPPPYIYKRWVAFGLLCSHSRLHGSNSYRVPWNIDEESSSVLREFTELKCRLAPYLYSLVVQASSRATAIPVSLRAMFIEFPKDPNCWNLDRQFMLGPSILVAPVFSESGEVDVYLPPGIWTNLFTGEKIKSTHGLWQKEVHTFHTLPLYVREGSVLVLGKEGERRVVYDYTTEVECWIYPDLSGDCFQVERGEMEMLLVDAEGNEKGVARLVKEQGGKSYELKWPEELGGKVTVRTGGINTPSQD